MVARQFPVDFVSSSLLKVASSNLVRVVFDLQHLFLPIADLNLFKDSAFLFSQEHA